MYIKTNAKKKKNSQYAGKVPIMATQQKVPF